MKGFFITIAVLAGGIAISYFISQDDKKDYVEQLKAEDYYGVVDSVFLDPDAKMQPKAMLESGLKVSVQNDIHEQVLPGDILFKKRGTLNYYLVHKGDTNVYYQEYSGEEVRN